MALDFPTSLPCPQTETVTPFDRGQRSSEDRPREARALSLDRLAIVRATWPPLSPADAQTFHAFWKESLLDGGAWFNATWPLPQGRVPAVFKFVQQPRFRFVPGGRWRVEAVLEQRGRGLSVAEAAPVGNSPTPWNTENEVGTWAFTNTDFTATSSAPGSYVVSVTSNFVGDFYMELVVDFDFDEGGVATIVAGLALSNPGTPLDGVGWSINGDIYVGGAVVDTQAPLVTGDVVRIALETATGKVWLGRNGTWIGDPSARTGEIATLGSGNEYWMAFSVDNNEAAYSCTLRTAASQYVYPVPTDFAEWVF